MLAHPKDMAKAFVEAWNTNDAGGIAALFDQDAEFVNVTGLWWHNRESILKAHRYGLDIIFHEATATLRRTTVKWVTEKVAVVHAKMEISGQTPFGAIQQTGTRQNIFSFVMKETDGGWICVSAHNTDIIPGMETAIKDAKGNLKHVHYGKKTR